jgi:nucleolar protein 15
LVRDWLACSLEAPTVTWPLTVSLVPDEEPRWDSDDDDIHDAAKNTSESVTKPATRIKARRSQDEQPRQDSDSAPPNKRKLISSVSSDKKKKKRRKEESAVLYLGHLPRHFEEDEIRSFLSQFGQVLRVKVARSARTGRSRGHAWCELKLPAVARIVAETLSGYIMFGTTRLVCHIVPLEQCHYGLFLPNRRPEEVLKDRALAAATTGTKSLEKMPAITQRLVARETKKREQLAALGIEYDFPGYSTSLANVVEGAKREIEAGSSKKKRRKDSTASEVSDCNTKEDERNRGESTGSSQSNEPKDERHGKKTKKGSREPDSTLPSIEQSEPTAESNVSLGVSQVKEQSVLRPPLAPVSPPGAASKETETGTTMDPSPEAKAQKKKKKNKRKSSDVSVSKIEEDGRKRSESLGSTQSGGAVMKEGSHGKKKTASVEPDTLVPRNDRSHATPKSMAVNLGALQATEQSGAQSSVEPASPPDAASKESDAEKPATSEGKSNKKKKKDKRKSLDVSGSKIESDGRKRSESLGSALDEPVPKVGGHEKRDRSSLEQGSQPLSNNQVDSTPKSNANDPPASPANLGALQVMEQSGTRLLVQPPFSSPDAAVSKETQKEKPMSETKAHKKKSKDKRKSLDVSGSRKTKESGRKRSESPGSALGDEPVVEEGSREKKKRAAVERDSQLRTGEQGDVVPVAEADASPTSAVNLGVQQVLEAAKQLDSAPHEREIEKTPAPSSEGKAHQKKKKDKRKPLDVSGSNIEEDGQKGIESAQGDVPVAPEGRHGIREKVLLETNCHLLSIDQSNEASIPKRNPTLMGNHGMPQVTEQSGAASWAEPSVRPDAASKETPLVPSSETKVHKKKKKDKKKSRKSL